MIFWILFYPLHSRQWIYSRIRERGRKRVCTLTIPLAHSMINWSVLSAFISHILVKYGLQRYLGSDSFDILHQFERLLKGHDHVKFKLCVLSPIFIDSELYIVQNCAYIFQIGKSQRIYRCRLQLGSKEFTDAGFNWAQSKKR